MRSITIILILIVPFCCAAQREDPARLDSLLAELSKVVEDTNGVKLLAGISGDYSDSNHPDSGIQYGKRALDLAQKLEWKKGIALASNLLGAAYGSKSEYPTALEYFFKVLKINEEIGDTIGIAVASGNIGLIYYSGKNYPKSLEYGFKSLKIFEVLGNKQGIKSLLGNIGIAYMKSGKYDEALKYQRRSLKLAEDQDDRWTTMIALSNIGAIYSELKDYPKALEYFSKALEMAVALNHKQTIAVNLGNMGEAYVGMAKDSLKRNEKPAKLAKGIEYLHKGITAAREIRYNEVIPEFSRYLAEAYRLQGDYKKALQAYEQYTAVKDSLYNTENSTKISNLETKRAIELKDKDIQIANLAIAKKRNERGFFIACIALLLGIMGVLFGSFRKQRRSNHQLAREKKRSDDLLLNILPAEVAEELKESGGAHAKQYDHVSVLFTDFVDFTGASEHLSPQQLVKELHECFTAFDAIIGRNGLEKIKTIGDAYMAVCGLPVTDPLHARKTVQAALEIRDFIEARRDREPVFEIRIGINSGPVVAGIVGVKKFAYDIWGDTVNTANRMEQHGAPGRINISHNTHKLIKDDFRCDYRGKVAAKNKGEIEMYFVEAAVVPSR